MQVSHDPTLHLKSITGLRFVAAFLVGFIAAASVVAHQHELLPDSMNVLFFAIFLAFGVGSSERSAYGQNRSSGRYLGLSSIFFSMKFGIAWLAKATSI